MTRVEFATCGLGALAVRLAAALSLALAFAPAQAQAHDFWMDFGSGWRAEPGEALTMRFLVGHLGEEEDWNFRRERIVHFQRAAPGRPVDLSAMLVDKTADAPGGARVAFDSAGSQLLAFETNEVASELPAEKFNAYARAEGLARVIAARRGGRESDPGREVYSRRAKAIVQIGPVATDTVSLALGHTLEIVPEKNPLMLEPGEPLPVRVLWRGEPLAGALVHLQALSDGHSPEVAKVSDATGRASFELPRRGAWKLDTVWSEPIDDPHAEFRTVFASLSFGF